MAAKTVLANGGRAGRDRRGNHGYKAAPRQTTKRHQWERNWDRRDQKARRDQPWPQSERGIATPRLGRRGAGPPMMTQSPRLRTERIVDARSRPRAGGSEAIDLALHAAIIHIGRQLVREEGPLRLRRNCVRSPGKSCLDRPLLPVEYVARYGAVGPELACAFSASEGEWLLQVA
jgi:hypothetical protein